MKMKTRASRLIWTVLGWCGMATLLAASGCNPHVSGGGTGGGSSGAGSAASTSSSTGAGGGLGGGEVLWTDVFQCTTWPNANCGALDLAADPAGNTFLGLGLNAFATLNLNGTTVASASQQPSGALVELDGAGSFVSTTPFEDQRLPVRVFLAFDGAGTPYAAVSSYTPPQADEDVVIHRFGPSPWQKTFASVVVPVTAYGFFVDPAGSAHAFLSPTIPLPFDYGGGPVSGPALVNLDASGNYLSSGTAFYATPAFPNDAGDVFFDSGGTLEKVSPQGQLLWSKTYITAGTALSGDGYAPDGLGGVWGAFNFKGTLDFGGGPLTSGAGYALALVKLDPMGNQLAAKVYSNAPYVQDLSLTAAGPEVALTGIHVNPIDLGAGPLTGGTFIAKFDASGSLKWQMDLGDKVNMPNYRLAVDPTGNVLVMGPGKGLPIAGSPPQSAADGSWSFVAKLRS